MSASTISATVTAGQTASYALSLASQGGFTGPVSLTCTGAPTAATFSLSPSSVTPAAAGTTPVTVRVTTTARSMAASRPPSPTWLGFAKGVAAAGLADRALGACPDARWLTGAKANAPVVGAIRSRAALGHALGGMRQRGRNYWTASSDGNTSRYLHPHCGRERLWSDEQRFSNAGGELKCRGRNPTEEEPKAWVLAPRFKSGFAL